MEMNSLDYIAEREEPDISSVLFFDEPQYTCFQTVLHVILVSNEYHMQCHDLVSVIAYLKEEHYGMPFQ